MKYKREDIIEKIIDDYTDNGIDQILEHYRDLLYIHLDSIDDDTLLNIADGLCITNSEDEIED